MAMINEATQSQRLNTHAAGTTALGQGVSQGNEDYLQVAGRFDALGNFIKPYSDALSELLDKGGTVTGKVIGAGGGLGSAREKLKALQARDKAEQAAQPAPVAQAEPVAPLVPGGPAIGEMPTALDGSRIC